MAGFTELVEFVVNGERVNAGVAGRATRAIDGNTRYLRDVVDTILAGQTIIARCKIINSAAKEGQTVFFSPVTQQFEPALGQVTVDVLTNLLVTAPSAQVWGGSY